MLVRSKEVFWLDRLSRFVTSRTAGVYNAAAHEATLRAVKDFLTTKLAAR